MFPELSSTLRGTVVLSLLGLLGLAGTGSAADDPRLEARKRAREAEVARAGVARALSKEMPESVKALPVFGEIEWTVNEMPFVEKGPHAGISGAGMVVVDGRIYLAGGFIPAGDETQEASRRTSRWTHRFDPKTNQWTRLPDLPARREYTRATSSGHSVYVLGGAVQGRPTLPSADVYLLDVSQSPLQWRTVPPMTVARSHLSVGVVGSQLIAAGGNKYDIAEKGYSQHTIQGLTERLDLAQPGERLANLRAHPRPSSRLVCDRRAGWKVLHARRCDLDRKGKTTAAGNIELRSNEGRVATARRFSHAHLGLGMRCLRRTATSSPSAAPGRTGTTCPSSMTQSQDRWMRIASPLPPGAVFNDPGVCIIGDTIYVAGGEGPGGSHFNHFLIGKIKPRPTTAKAAGAGLDTGQASPHRLAARAVRG